MGLRLGLGPRQAWFALRLGLHRLRLRLVLHGLCLVLHALCLVLHGLCLVLHAFRLGPHRLRLGPARLGLGLVLLPARPGLALGPLYLGSGLGPSVRLRLVCPGLCLYRPGPLPGRPIPLLPEGAVRAQQAGVRLAFAASGG
ncbi:hypothetical protein [Streptomyces sp. NPDC003863]